MEELTPFDDGLIVLNSDVKPIESYIEETIQPTFDNLLLFCPLHLTTPVYLPAMTDKTDNGRKIGFITIPEDFIRIHTIKMKGWERPVHRPITIENPDYLKQLNLYTRGGSAKPVVLKREKLELYTFSLTDEIETKTYVQSQDINEVFEVNEKLYEPLCFMVASNVYAVFGNKQAEYMAMQAQNLLKLEL